MTRAYLRLDPGFFERKLDQGYPPAAQGAFIAVLCLADAQTTRGYFRDEGVLRALLTPRFARWLPFLFEHGDLIRDGKRVYVDGWKEWQEGDVTVPERMAIVLRRRGETYSRQPGAIRQAQYRERSRIFERDQFTCRYCGNGKYPREWLVLEHVIPDGPTTDENLVTACRPCNKLKGPRTPEAAGMTLLPVPSNTLRDPLRNTSPTSVTPSSGERRAEQDKAGNGAPSRAPSLSENERREAIERNRALLEDSQDPGIQRAAIKALRLLGAA